MTQNDARKAEHDWFSKIALLITLAICSIGFFTSGCGSKVGSLSDTITSDPCLAAGIEPWEEQEIMDAAWYDANVLYASYSDEYQSVVNSCWNNSVSAYQATNCIDCAIPLVDYVYAQ